MFKLRWVVFILIFSFISLPASPVHAEEIEASVEVLESRVEIMELGTKSWETVHSDTFVSSGDRIRTDETGSALITWFGDGTFIELQPNSELIIEEFSVDDESFVIDASLIQGSILNSVRRLIDQSLRYQINTSNMTATVRGTVFAVSLDDETMNTTVAVVEGTVHAENLYNPTIFVPVEAGNLITVATPEDIANTTLPTNFTEASAEYSELILNLNQFYDSIPEEFPAEAENDVDDVRSNSIPNNSGSNNTKPDISTTGGNGNGNNGNGNGNGGSNGNNNNGNGNTGGNNGEGNNNN